jgi:hypothetical protein
MKDAFAADLDSICDRAIDKDCEGIKICAKKCTLLEQNGLSGATGDNRQQCKHLELKMDDRAAQPDFLVSLPLNQWIVIDEKVSVPVSEIVTNSENFKE